MHYLGPYKELPGTPAEIVAAVQALGLEGVVEFPRRHRDELYVCFTLPQSEKMFVWSRWGDRTRR